ncbi:Aste57867_16967 [Aphanomyces stellatus]|uniref:Aste57867_16967 protein n=1 Tax=Aphanomyces stellatus TaxID=120398 RepID=A0A485L6S9_9STRA|nr:hypothetical protein As57867_016909 [Aphanomyces stellatus]VFT93729.1 Aste57867_16967 [Aphanomyces stellatus]
MGAAMSDYFTNPIDVSDGYYEDADPYIVIHDACAKGKHHTASLYFKRGGDPNEKCFEDDDVYERDDTPMICAARGCPSVGMRGGTKKHFLTMQIVLMFGGDVNAFNKLHQTPLYVAVTRGYLTVAVWLVENGADVNICDSVGVSPLLCAARACRADLVALLLECKANVQAPPRPNTCVHFPTIADEMPSFDPAIQAMLQQGLRDQTGLSTSSSSSAPRQSLATGSQLLVLKDQLRLLPPRAATAPAPVLTAPPHETEAARERRRQRPSTVPSSTEPSSVQQVLRVTDAKRSVILDLGKCRIGGSWVKKRDVSGRIHVAEWEFVKATFVNQDAARVHDTMEHASCTRHLPRLLATKDKTRRRGNHRRRGGGRRPSPQA